MPPDVSEVILSRRLTEEYRPASNNSQPSCSPRATITQPNNTSEENTDVHTLAKPTEDVF